MAGPSRTLTYRVVGDERDFLRSMGRVDRTLGSSGRAAQRFGSLTSGAMRGVSAAAAVGVGALAIEAKRSYSAFIESNKVAKQTNAVLKSTGGAAKVTAKDVAGLSAALSRKSGLDDELIQSGANVLLTFKQIRNEAGAGNDIFDQATQAALDLSVALDKDLGSTSIQVGKALNDPIKGVTALGRAGVQFTDQQKDQITTLVESNRTLDAQKIILGELQSQVGGSAEAQATAMGRAKVAIENVEEALGTGLAPVVDDVADKITDLATQATPKLEKVSKEIGKLFTRDDLDLGEKLTFSGQAIKRRLGPVVKDIEAELERVDAGGKLAGAIDKGVPLIMDAAAAAAPQAAGRFVKAWLDAGPWAKLLTVGFLAGKLGAFSALGSLAGGKFASAVKKRWIADTTLQAAAAAEGAAAGNALAAGAGASVDKAAKGSRWKNIARGFGRSFGVLAGVAAVYELGKILDAETERYYTASGDSAPVGFAGKSPTRTRMGGTPPIVTGGGIGRRNEPPRPRGDRPTAGPRGKIVTAGASRVQSRFMAHASSTTPPLAAFLSGRFGLTFTSGYRDPQRNAAAGGVPNSWHTRGTPARPGAIDLVGSMAAMQNGLAWARANVPGLAEAMIHDAGSGLHLHLAGTGVMNWSGGGGATTTGGTVAASVSAAVAPRGPSRFERRMAGSDVRLARAQSTSRRGDDIGALRARRRIVGRRVDFIESRLKSRNLSPARRVELQQELAGLIGDDTGLRGELRDLRTPEFTFADEQDSMFDLALAQAAPDSPEELAALTRQSMVLGVRRDFIQRQLRRKGLSRAKRIDLRGQLAGLESTLASNQQRGRELLSAPAGDPRQQELSAINASAALAALTPDTADDRHEAEALQGFWTRALAEARASGNFDAITEAATSLKSASDTLASIDESMKENQRPLIAAVDELTTQMKRANDLQRNVGQAQVPQFLNLLYDVMNNRHGQSWLANQQTVGAPGSVMRT